MGISPLAVFLAGMACMVVGFLWYSPILFAKPWMKGMGWDSVSAEQIAAAKKKAGPMYALSLIFSFLAAAVLIKFFSAVGVHTTPKALQIAGAAWLDSSCWYRRPAQCSADRSGWCFSSIPRTSSSA